MFIDCKLLHVVYSLLTVNYSQWRLTTFHIFKLYNSKRISLCFLMQIKLNTNNKYLQL